MPVMSIPTVTNMTNMTNMTNTAFRSTPNILLNDANYNNISSATSTTIYYTIATILSLTFVIGVFFNSMAIFIFIKNRELRTPTNSFVMTLCLCDLFMCLLGVTVPTVKAWQRSPIHSHALCVFDGFVVYFFGLSSMYLLAAISVDRYVVIVRPMGSLMVTHRIALLGIGLCFGLGLFWTLMPLLGWNRFVPEGIGVSCSIWWGSADPASTSYIFTILVFCLLLPLLVMALCYINIYWMISKVARQPIWGPNSHISQINNSRERRMLRTIVIMLGAFLVSWTPYAVVSLAQTFSGRAVVDPVTETFPALIAKMSAIWDPLIYIATNLKFRQAFFGVAPCCRLWGCLRENQSEASDTVQDELGPVLEEARSRRPRSLQSLDLPQKMEQTEVPGVRHLEGFGLDLNGKSECVTLALLGEEGMVVCKLAEKAVETIPLGD